jgi:hypothetical protein
LLEINAKNYWTYVRHIHGKQHGQSWVVLFNELLEEQDFVFKEDCHGINLNCWQITINFFIEYMFSGYVILCVQISLMYYGDWCIFSNTWKQWITLASSRTCDVLWMGKPEYINCTDNMNKITYVIKGNLNLYIYLLFWTVGRYNAIGKMLSRQYRDIM